MAQVLRSVNATTHPNLLVGSDTGDDAAVWARPDGTALVSTADFFTPVVDDAFTWGRIAAVNAVSDVYAMGATPMFALNLVAWPRDVLPLELLAKVMEGGSSVAAEAGYVVAGGHTVDGPEPMFGQSVVGEVLPNQMLTNAGLRVGDQLILTKPLGTGLVATAVKRSEPGDIAAGGWLHDTYEAAVKEMTRLNAAAASAAVGCGATGATDVTGFGLLGHLGRMATASGVSCEIHVAEIPLLTGARQLIDDGFVPGGTMRNLEYVRGGLDEGTATEEDMILLADAQTAGGLLFGCTADAAADVVADLLDSGHGAAAVGVVTTDHAGKISLR